MSRTSPGPLRRVAMLSAHTSPLDLPGRGDAGGMNVYVLELSRRLADAGVEVEVFTRADRPGLPPAVEAAPGVTVRHVAAGPYGRLTKTDLPAQLCAFTRDVLRVEAEHPGGWYDLVHSHYWLSGQVATVVADRWGVPLVHSMHTMAKVKNASLAAGDVAEPVGRVVGEEQVVAAADRLVANTEDEAAALVRLYGADPHRVDVVHPGVDLEVFRPRDTAEARRALDVPLDAHLVLFAGRIQPLKAPDVLVRAVGELLGIRPDLRDRMVVAVVGGPSGTGLDRPEALADLTAALGLGDVVRLVPPVDQITLARWYSAASVVVVPSYNESFGLVALEAQACGTPVVAAAVGGLVTAVRDRVSGVLVDGHDPVDYAAALVGLIDDPGRRARMGAAAVQHAAAFGWGRTADETRAVYADVLARRRVEDSPASVVGL